MFINIYNILLQQFNPIILSENLKKKVNNVIQNLKKKYISEGIQNDEFIKPTNYVYKSNSFISTSSSPSVGLRFISSNSDNDEIDNKKNGNKVIQKITILPGTNVLMCIGVSSFPSENEFLLSSNTKYYIVDESLLYNPNADEICKNTKENIKRSDIVVIE